MNYFDPLSSTFWVTIGVAILCGVIVGLERQLRGKPAGVRTSCLICLSTAVFINLGSGIVDAGTDPTRVLGQLVTGVGFLGGGVILAREGVVTGVTTAAVIWILAAIGAVVGYGHMLGAIALSVVTVGILTGVEFLESAVRFLRRGIYSSERSSENGDSY
jgi:putative Mg2+ transporter-C (MgtC) family protein